MKRGIDFRFWDELIPEALGLIFQNLSLQEILTVVPKVCRSWGKVVTGPYCWQEIDIEEWSDMSEPDTVDRMLQMLIVRSCGSLRKLCVSELQNDRIFSFIAEHASSLCTLRLPRSNMSDVIVEQVAWRLSTVTFLDLSYCVKIGARALEAIGKHCKLLTGLRRAMHPIGMYGKVSQEEEEAHSIASTMPKLKHLEIAYGLIGTEIVLEIISNCLELELLDLRGCWHVKLDDKCLMEKFPKLKVLRPRVVDNRYESDYDSRYDSDHWDFRTDITEPTNSFEEMWNNDERGMFCGQFYDDSASDWSP